MSKKSSKEEPVVPNEISDSTGQYDMRFLLWRQFCAKHQLPVSTMPGDLDSDMRAEWEQLKEERLHRKAENR